MKKYVYSSLAWALAMYVAFMIVSMIEMQFIPMEVYSVSPFKDFSDKMGLLTLYILALKVFHSFILSYVHELIPRCWSSLWEKTWRFGLLSFFLVFATGLTMTALTMDLGCLMVGFWALNWLAQSLLWSAVIIHVLYKFPAPDTTCQLKR